MKKILSAVIVFCVMIFSANCQAQVVRVADIGAENFYAKMMKFFEDNKIDIPRSKLSSNLDDNGNKTWECKFFENSYDTDPSAIVLFDVDNAGYVSRTIIISAGNYSITTNVMSAAFTTIGITQSETDELARQIGSTNTQIKVAVASVWSYSKNKKFVIAVIPIGNLTEFVISADDGRN